jgi:hypothetical protein
MGKTRAARWLVESAATMGKALSMGCRKLWMIPV